VRTAAESEVLELVVVADVDLERATAAVDRRNDARFVARALDASKAAAISELASRERVDVVLNACDPRLDPSISAALSVPAATSST
jgi:saccharopine dehydrogenase (NAD+, L-lysine forming)